MSEHKHDPAVKDTFESLVKGMPGVKAGKAFGYPAYKVNGKVFAFVGTGISIKLPAARVQELIASNPQMKVFEVADRVVWREWVSIQRPKPDDYAQDMDLFEESVLFVAGG
jgi:hypothetical protein